MLFVGELASDLLLIMQNILKEVNKLRSTAVRLASHLAQVPSSAVHFKDVSQSMHLTHRQQFQGFIRVSVTQEHKATKMKPTTPFLEIK
ncbi:hypothetical protein RchiOBHm_Chr2g0166391 [Rosa chinensis]|uniref:Uncharacterized protein n=1 Tax=Rosa chinensis TaxID=74649 RepID=A0A2P6S423_ROSCH|nr:hypothetical protein RchiOBHm_Chr2g0166391 [Rosa chinensis]